MGCSHSNQRKYDASNTVAVVASNDDVTVAADKAVIRELRTQLDNALDRASQRQDERNKAQQDLDDAQQALQKMKNELNAALIDRNQLSANLQQLTLQFQAKAALPVVAPQNVNVDVDVALPRKRIDAWEWDKYAALLQTAVAKANVMQIERLVADGAAMLMNHVMEQPKGQSCINERCIPPSADVSAVVLLFMNNIPEGMKKTNGPPLAGGDNTVTGTKQISHLDQITPITSRSTANAIRAMDMLFEATGKNAIEEDTFVFGSNRLIRGEKVKSDWPIPGCSPAMFMDPDILDHAFKIGMVTPTGIVGMVRKGIYDDISTGGERTQRWSKGDYCGCSEDTKAQIDLTMCALVWRAYVRLVKGNTLYPVNEACYKLNVAEASAVLAEAKPRLAECMRVIKRNGGISEYERVTLPKETRAYLADWVSYTAAKAAEWAREAPGVRAWREMPENSRKAASAAKDDAADCERFMAEIFMEEKDNETGSASNYDI